MAASEGRLVSALRIGETMTEVAMSLGPDALRAPAGPLPAAPADEDALSEPLAAAKAEAERRITGCFATGRGLASSSVYNAVAFFSTGLGDEHTHDAQIEIPRDRLHPTDLGRRLPAPGVGVLRGPGVLLEDLGGHNALTVYHETSTCRIGDVVDPRLRVHGVEALRVADASVMPNVVSGNTDDAASMIGEKAAELIATDRGAPLHEVVG